MQVHATKKKNAKKIRILLTVVLIIKKRSFAEYFTNLQKLLYNKFVKFRKIKISIDSRVALVRAIVRKVCNKSSNFNHYSYWFCAAQHEQNIIFF